MPVITFLQDVFMAFKGPYERHVGKHTVNFCKRIGRHKLSEGLRQTFTISAVSADEVVAALMKVDNRRDAAAFSGIPVVKKPTPQNVKFALKAYISALLVIFGTNKQQLLAIVDQNEQEFIDMWTDMYGYGQDDMKLFNELLQSYQKNGIQGISCILCSVMEGIWEHKIDLQDQHIEFFAQNLTEDVNAILSQINKHTGIKNGMV